MVLLDAGIVVVVAVEIEVVEEEAMSVTVDAVAPVDAVELLGDVEVNDDVDDVVVVAAVVVVR